MELEQIKAEIASIDVGADEAVPVVAAEDLPALPDYRPDTEQVITVGSQIAEFSKGVPVDLRSTITNCLLLAQLAADRWVETHVSDELTWYNCYLAVLKKCGWMLERDETSLKMVAGNGARVHQEIVQVLATALGPVASAASIILGVVTGLSTMQKDQPFLTIFDRASKHADAQLFQISYVDAGAGKVPRLNFAAYRVNATTSATQILFFKFAGNNAQLRSSIADLTVDESILRAAKDQIFDKVGGRLIGNITEIEI